MKALPWKGPAIDGCQDLAVAGPDAVVCSTTVGEAAGKAAVEAAFTPATAAFKAASGTREVEVGKAKTSLGDLVLSATSTVHGHGGVTAGIEVFNATTGSVEFFDGNASLGTAEVSAEGQATLELPKTLAAGEHTIHAKFTGTDRLKASPRVVAEQTLTVAKSASSVAAPVLGATSTVYGTTAVKATATVTGATSGMVEFFDGKASLGTAKVASNGTATLALPKTLAAGTHKVTAAFRGTANVTASKASAATKLTVAKAALASKAKVAGKPVRKNAKPTVTVTLGKLQNGSYPTGKVTVKTSGWSKTVTLKASDKGQVKVLVNKKFARSAKVSAKYLGTANTAASGWAGTTITVK